MSREMVGGAEAVRTPAVVLTVGDELLSGERVDTNGPWIAAFLETRGFRLREILSVGDEEGEIVDGLSHALLGGRLVVVTGGLGPTEDDRTREAAARLLNLPLAEDPALLEGLEARFRVLGYDRLPMPNRRMALVPSGASILPNGEGSAPGLVLPAGEHRLILLPGIPREMRHLMETGVAPLLEEWFPRRSRAPRSVVLRTTGIAESLLAERIDERLAEQAVPSSTKVAYRPSLRGVELRISAEGEGAEERLREALEAVDPVVRPYRYEAPSGDLAEAVLEACLRRGWTLSVAESCTGGMVGARLTAVPGSSRVFRGGVVAYHDEVKQEILGVPGELLRSRGAVSEEAARVMAEGVARCMHTELAISVTGIAGPGGAVPGKPVGTVWFGLHAPAGGGAWMDRFAGGREVVRERSTQRALKLLADVAHLGFPEKNPGSG